MIPGNETVLDGMLGNGPGTVQLVFAESVTGFLSNLKNRSPVTDGALRFLCVSFDRLPAIKALVEKTLHSLAEVALALWPDWYTQVIDFAALAGCEVAFEQRLAAALAKSKQLRSPVIPAWVHRGRRLCQAGALPLTKAFSPALQARQLALAIEPCNLLIVLATRDETPALGTGLGLARVAEWLNRQTDARIAVVVPRALGSNPELDGISYQATTWSTPDEKVDTSNLADSEVRVWPVLGRPHPYSPGEQLLAKRLARDPALSRLFHFNVAVETRFKNHYRVDLLWAEGKVVVEIDGYHFHSDPAAFSHDRRRDYELLVTDYLVLRLPHQEVMDDVDLAIEKIRKVVRFRQGSQSRGTQ